MKILLVKQLRLLWNGICMKIFLITNGEYDNYLVERVFSIKDSQNK